MAKAAPIKENQQTETTQSPAASERETLHEQIYKRIKISLISGQFAPGQNLALRSVAQALGTSHMPVRDAFRRLLSEHALMLNANRTLSVPELTEQALYEMRDIRIALEGLAAEKAAQHAIPETIATASEFFQDMKQATERRSISDYLLSNWKFHFTVYSTSGSEMLTALIEPIWMRLGPYARLASAENLVETLDNHSRIIYALEHKDPQLARNAIVQDILDSAEIVKLALFSKNSIDHEPAQITYTDDSMVDDLAFRIKPLKRGRPPKLK